jgi:hypothetical protein
MWCDLLGHVQRLAGSWRLHVLPDLLLLLLLLLLGKHATRRTRDHGAESATTVSATGYPRAPPRYR